MPTTLSPDQLEILRNSFPSARGRKGGSQDPFYLRDLCGEDVELIINPPPLGSTPPAIKRLRTQHHQLARVLAQGSKNEEAAAITGYSISRVSILQQDPAFKELVAYYKAQADAQFLDVHSQLANLGEAVVQEIQERLEQDPDKIPLPQLLRIGEFALDRSSAPPKTRAGGVGEGKVPNITISFHNPTGQPGTVVIDGTGPEALPPPDGFEDLP